MTRRIAWISGVVVTFCALGLIVDWAVDRTRAPKDDHLVKALQKQVKEDAAVSTPLDAEQKRITAARQARKRRDRIAGWTLIAAASIFLTACKRLVQPARPSAPGKPAPSRPKKKRSNKKSSVLPDLDLAFVDRIVAEHGRGKEAAIPLLQAIQTHYRYLPDEALRRLCELTDITPAEIAGASSFYGQFRRSPVGKHIVRVCHGTACHVAGARQITDELRRHLKLPDGADTDADRMFTLEEVACLGCCSLAPVLMVDEHAAGRLTPATATEALDSVEPREPA